MLLRLYVLGLLLITCVLIESKYYKPYNRKTTPKPTTPKPIPPKPTTPKPTTARPKPYYPAMTTPYKPSKPGYTSKPSGGGGGGKPSKGMPYKFEYSANVGSPDPTGMIAQSESGDANGVVTGSYSLRDPDGRERTVIYKADSSGFRATVETNELPPDVPNPADVTIIGSGPAPSMGATGSPSGGGEASSAEYGSTSGYEMESTEGGAGGGGGGYY